ncbi:MAG TPA: sigma-70 family RNA polymerase sigma factor [Acidobacteriaceae bacterium]
MTAPGRHAPDAALVEQMTAGDESALAALYDRYAGVLYGLLLRILKDTHAAEEVLQDLFLQLWRTASRFDASRGSMTAWLMVIARNRAISRLRRGNRHAVVDDPEGFLLESAPDPANLEDEAERRQLAGRLRAAMASLPGEQREALELAYFEGMTQTEIAERTGAPLGTVKSRVRAALQSLRQHFDERTAR